MSDRAKVKFTTDPPRGVIPPILGPELIAELAQHKGRWVALDQPAQSLIAVGDSAEEVYERADSLQVDHPLVLFVPARPPLPRI